jgi:hypothetical protein
MWIHFAALLLQANLALPCDPEPTRRVWRIETVDGPIRVFTTSDHPERIAVYVHGYRTTVDQAWSEHRLREQFEESCLPWLFVVPEAPEGPRDAVRFPRLDLLLDEVKREIGALPPGPIVALGHSGAYRTLRPWLSDPRVSTILLLDAAYGDLEPFAAWMRRDPAHSMILLGRSTLAGTRWLSHAIGADPECAADVFSAHARLPRASCFRTREDHMQIVERGAVIPAVLRMSNEISPSLPSDASSATTDAWPSARRSKPPPYPARSVAGS